MGGGVRHSCKFERWRSYPGIQNPLIGSQGCKPWGAVFPIEVSDDTHFGNKKKRAKTRFVISF